MNIERIIPSMESQRQWQVLLLGGASGVGKSSLSYPLAKHLGLNLIEVDDFQVALEKLSTPEQQPLLHFWRTHWDEFSAWSDQQHLAHSIQVSREVFQPALESIIVNHLRGERPVILEGDFLLPELAVFERFDGEANVGRVRGLFVYEDEAQIAANYLNREAEEQSERAHSSFLYSQWLCSECERLGVPSVSARPWGTLMERVLSAIG